MIVYCATNTANGKAYVGATKQALARRISEHKSRAGKQNRAFSNALAKYGADRFHWEVLAHCADAEAMQAAETFFIRHLNTLADGGNGYNRTAGGGGTLGFAFSAASRERMSKARAGVERIPIDRRGRQAPLFDPRVGRPQTREHIERKRLAMMGTHNARRLHPEFASAIFAMREAGKTHDQIASAYGVSRPAISLFIKRNGG